MNIVFLFPAITLAGCAIYFCSNVKKAETPKERLFELSLVLWFSLFCVKYLINIFFDSYALNISIMGAALIAAIARIALAKNNALRMTGFACLLSSLSMASIITLMHIMQ